MWADQALMTLGAGAAVAFTEPLTLNGRLAVTAAGSAVVDLAALAGTGLYAQRGGRLALTNAAAAACTVPLQLRNVELFELGSGTHAFPFTAEDVVFAPTSGATAVVALKAPFEVERSGAVADGPWTEDDEGSVTLNVEIVPGLYYAAASAASLDGLVCPGASAPATAATRLVVRKPVGSPSGFFKVWVSERPLAAGGK